MSEAAALGAVDSESLPRNFKIYQKRAVAVGFAEEYHPCRLRVSTVVLCRSKSVAFVE